MPQAPGLGFDHLLTPDLLCSCEVTCSLPLPRLTALILWAPCTPGPGDLALGWAGPCSVTAREAPPPSAQVGLLQRLRLLADLTPCALTGNTQSETPDFHGAALLRGFCKVVNFCGPTQFHCGSWLGQNPEGWPWASWVEGGGQPWSPRESRAPRPPGSFLRWAQSLSLPVTLMVPRRPALVLSLLEMRADVSYLASTRTGAVFSPGERPVEAVGGGQAWAVVGPLVAGPHGMAPGVCQGLSLAMAVKLAEAPYQLHLLLVSMGAVSRVWGCTACWTTGCPQHWGLPCLLAAVLGEEVQL